MKTIIIGLVFLGLTSLCHAQVLEEKTLSEVEVHATNYHYLKSVEAEFIPYSVRSLEIEVANFDVNESSVIIVGDKNVYPDENGKFNVNFANNYGVINAVYNEEGLILRATEKFKNIKLPPVILKSILEKYPEYIFAKDLYLVTYDREEGTTRNYIIFIKNKNKRVKINSDENGNIS